MPKYDRAYFEREAQNIREECRARRIERRREQGVANGTIPFQAFGRWGLFYSHASQDQDGCRWHNYELRNSQPYKPVRVRTPQGWRSVHKKRNVFHLGCLSDGIGGMFADTKEVQALRKVMPKKCNTILQAVRRDAAKREGQPHA